MARNNRRERHNTISVLHLDEKNVVHFGFYTDSPEFISGIELLLQNVIINLFTTQGSNRFNNNLGGGIYDIIGKGYTVGQEDSVKAEFALAFSTVEAQIKSEQEGMNLLPEEKLENIDLLSLEYEQNTQSWIIDAKVKTAGGNLAAFTVKE
jgi:phage baseplate assembly protein W